MLLPGIGSVGGLQASVASAGSLMAVSVPANVSKTQGSFGPGALALTTNNAVCQATGGLAPYTYLWSQVSGDAMVPTAPAFSSCRFGANVNLGDTLSAVFKCTVTDANGATTEALANAELHHADMN